MIMRSGHGDKTMCQKYYRKCQVCGDDCHIHEFCGKCLKKIDPWGILTAGIEELKELRRQMAIIKSAFKKNA
jgi:hypothetical protein